MTERRAALAFDLGGTRLRAALVDEGGSLLAWERHALAAREPEAVVTTMAAVARRLLRRCGLSPTDLAGAGCSVPGPLVRATGVVSFSPNLGWCDYPLGRRLAPALRLPVSIDDDANCAALGEAWLGAARGHADAVCLVVGTGIGAGLILGGALYHGAHDAAGEVGHMVIDPGGPPCPCGASGCLESLASGRSIAEGGRQALRAGEAPVLAELARGNPEAVTAATVFAAARKREPASVALLAEAGRSLGVGLANVALAFDPEVIVLSGSVGLAGGVYRREALRTLRRRGFSASVARTPVRRGRLGDRAGLLGAAAVVLHTSPTATSTPASSRRGSVPGRESSPSPERPATRGRSPGR